MTIEKIRQIFI